MIRFTLTALAVLVLFTAPAFAQIAASGGVTRDWIRSGDGADYQELATPMAGVAYDMALNDAGTQGITISLRGSDGEDLIQEYGLDYWTVGRIEAFVGATVETWSADYTGSTEFLGGVRGGIRGDTVGGAPVELSGSYAMGSDGKRHVGLFLGLRIVAPSS